MGECSYLEGYQRTRISLNGIGVINSTVIFSGDWSHDVTGIAFVLFVGWIASINFWGLWHSLLIFHICIDLKRDIFEISWWKLWFKDVAILIYDSIPNQHCHIIFISFFLLKNKNLNEYDFERKQMSFCRAYSPVQMLFIRSGQYCLILAREKTGHS